mgnify:CR=1 FL=1
METRQQHQNQNKNMSVEIKEILYKNNNSDIESIMNNEDFFSDFTNDFEYFDQDNVLAQQIDYFENYTIKKLQHIASYYKIQKKNMKKDLLVQSIIEFENNPENSECVYNRKRMWHFVNELKNDSYFSKFVCFTI